MGHIFNAKHIKDERELKEGAGRSRGNDLTCLKPAFLRGAKKLAALTQKKKKKGSERLGQNQSGGHGKGSCDAQSHVLQELEGDISPTWAGLLLWGERHLPGGAVWLSTQKVCTACIESCGEQQPACAEGDSSKARGCLARSLAGLQRVWEKRNWCKRVQAGTYLGYLLWVSPKQQARCQQVRI